MTIEPAPTFPLSPGMTETDLWMTSIALIRSRLGVPTPENNESFHLLVAPLTYGETISTISSLASFAALILEEMPELFEAVTNKQWPEEADKDFATEVLDSLVGAVLDGAISSDG